MEGLLEVNWHVLAPHTKLTLHHFIYLPENGIGIHFSILFTPSINYLVHSIQILLHFGDNLIHLLGLSRRMRIRMVVRSGGTPTAALFLIFLFPRSVKTTLLVALKKVTTSLLKAKDIFNYVLASFAKMAGCHYLGTDFLGRLSGSTGCAQHCRLCQ